MVTVITDDDLPLEVEEFLSWLVTERGRAANTIAAYRRDLTAYTRWLSAHGEDVGSVDTATLVELLTVTQVSAASDSGVLAAPVSASACLGFSTISPMIWS